MPAGSSFTDNERAEIDRVLRAAYEQTGLRFSVWVGSAAADGASGGGREHARRLHAALGREATESVLVSVDPSARRLEVVTGVGARQRLSDRTCALAAMTMTSSFEVDDLANGITSGVNMLVEHARQTPTLHEHPSE